MIQANVDDVAMVHFPHGAMVTVQMNVAAGFKRLSEVAVEMDEDISIYNFEDDDGAESAGTLWQVAIGNNFADGPTIEEAVIAYCRKFKLFG